MPENELNIETSTPEATEAVGRALAELLPERAVVALQGDLATGKTCLVRGMAAFFAEGQPIHSPTFTLVNEYGQARKLYHLDLYRLTDLAEVADLGVEELFDPDGVCVVEWAERAVPLLPARRVDIHLEHGGGDLRRIRITDRGLLPDGWHARLDATQENVTFRR